MRWLEVHSSVKNAVLGLLLVEKRPQIRLYDVRKLIDGSIESSWIREEEIPRSPEVVKRMHHTSGEGQSWGSFTRLADGVGSTENDLKSQPKVVGGPSRAQARAPQARKRFHVPQKRSEDFPRGG